MIPGYLRFAQLVGDDGDVEVTVLVDGHVGTARVLWQPDVGTLDVLSASSPRVEAFVHQDHEVQDEAERLHSGFVAQHRVWRGGLQRVDA